VTGNPFGRQPDCTCELPGRDAASVASALLRGVDAEAVEPDDTDELLDLVTRKFPPRPGNAVALNSPPSAFPAVSGFDTDPPHAA